MAGKDLKRARFLFALMAVVMLGALSGCKDKYAEGSKYLTDGKFREASKYYEEQLKNNPKNAVLENQLGFASAKMGKFAKAEEHYKKALELKPDYPEASYNLGCLYMKPPMLKLEDAIKEFDKAISLNDDYAKAYNNRGYVEANLGKFDSAVKDIEKAIALEPDNKVYKDNLEWAKEMKEINESLPPKQPQTKSLAPAPASEGKPK